MVDKVDERGRQSSRTAEVRRECVQSPNTAIASRNRMNASRCAV